MALSNLNALSVAMHAEQDVAVRALKLQLEEKQLALERARMSAEDAYAAGSARDVFRNVIEPAKELLHDARNELRTALSAPPLESKAAMSAAHNAMLAAECFLEDNLNASESESES